MTTPAAPRAPGAPWTWARILIIVAVIFFAGSAAVTGGAWTSGPHWLGWAGLATGFLAFLA
jgi:hypothetical protein